MLKETVDSIIESFGKTLYKLIKIHFARSNRSSQNPGILLRKKASHPKTKTRYCYIRKIIFLFR